MSSLQRIQRAIDVICRARRTLRRLLDAAEEAELRRALRDLDEAAEQLQRAAQDTQD